MGAKTLFDFLSYAAFRVFLLVLTIPPLSAATAVGSFLGAAAFALGIRKRFVIGSIMRAFPDKSREQASEIARRLYKNTGLSAVEFARFEGLNSAYVERHISFEGLHWIDESLKLGKGVALLTAHFGNWELLSAVLAMKGYALSAVARPLDNRYMNEFISTRRSLFGNKVIAKKNAIRPMFEVLKRNSIVGILLDQRAARKEAVPADFLGMSAPTSKGLAMIVMRTGSPVVPVFLHRERGLRHRLVCMEPVPIANTGDTERDVRENTQAFTSAIETFVRLYPDEWFWFHSRWERRKRRGHAN
ncbi:MAG: lysophospholipid acyltransferase family protein [Thermodesulfobacteriota bacterium]